MAWPLVWFIWWYYWKLYDRRHQFQNMELFSPFLALLGIPGHGPGAAGPMPPGLMQLMRLFAFILPLVMALWQNKLTTISIHKI